MTTTPRRVALYADAYRDYVVELSASLMPIVDVTLVSPLAWSEDLGTDGSPPIEHVGFERPRMRDARSLAAARRLVRRIDELEVDLVHVQATDNPWMNLALATSRRPVPIVETVHDVEPHPGDRRTPRSGAWLARRWQRRVDRFIVHTPGLGRALSRHWGVAVDRQSVIPHGELGSRYRPLVSPGARAEERTVLFFGRIWPYKGLDVLVSAMGLLPTDRHTRLIVAGRGQPIEPYLRDLPPNVECEVIDRHVERSEVADLFTRATVVCLPHREASQSGVAAIAAGLGVPMVASDVGGVGETLRHDVDAVLVPPADARALAAALDELLDDVGRRQSMSQALRQRAATDLAWPTIAAKTADVYRMVAP